MMVNKIGDSDGKISSKACEMLKTFVRQFPAAKTMVIREVRVFIYRPNTKLTAVFTAVNFLTQIRLEETSFKTKKPISVNPARLARTAHLQECTDRQLALQLAECYLSLFEKAVQAKEEGSRLLTVLLNGINRVFPFLTDQDKNHESLALYMDSIFRLVHTATSFSTSAQALALLSHMVVASNNTAVDVTSVAGQKKNNLRDRYYVTLYNKLLSNDVSSTFFFLYFSLFFL
jgi:hypothetical protein